MKAVKEYIVMDTSDTLQPKILQHEDGSVEKLFADGSNSITNANGKSNWTAADGSHGYYDGQAYIEKTTADGNKFWTDEISGSMGRENIDGSNAIYHNDGSWSITDTQGNIESNHSWEGVADNEVDLGIVPLTSHSENNLPPNDYTLNNSTNSNTPSDNSMDNMADALNNATHTQTIEESKLPDVMSMDENDLEDNLNDQSSTNDDPNSII